jgi:hypothetical protein
MSFSDEEKSFFKFLRTNYFKNSDEFLKLIKQEYNEVFGEITKEKTLNDTSQIIENLITLGKEKWNSIRINIQKNWVETCLNNSNYVSSEFPNISIILKNLIDSLNSLETNNKKVVAVHQATFNITSNFDFSNKQFAKHLAGYAFEAYIKLLLQILDYKFETQKKITQGEALDFLYPNLQTVIANPSNCIVTECQSTLKDRFRLSQGKVPRGNPIEKYIFTAGGLGVVTNNDYNDLTNNKVSEIRDKGWKIVVFKKLKEQKFTDNPIVVTFEDFFNLHYPAKSTLW